MRVTKIIVMAKQLITPKEEEIISLLWQHGSKSVRELLEFYPDPKPHFNTISTFLRKLEEKGLVGHTSGKGGVFCYHPEVRPEDLRKNSLGKVVRNYFANSYLSAVSSLLEDEKISTDELRELIEIVEKNRKNNKKG